MRSTFLAALVSVAVFAAGCAPQPQTFDPNDPAAVSAIDAIMTAAVEAAGAIL
jgi:uncharacterized lipoprotein YajG